MHRTISLSVVLAALGGCGGYHASMDAGLTPGGLQDMTLAREIIEAGGIPDRSHYRAEGLFSEHDLTLAGEPCDALLCPRVAMARIETVGHDEPRMLAQLGFASNIDLETFERDALDLVVAIDVSCSMSDGKLAATRHALQALVGQLDEDDTLGLVDFDDEVSVIAGSQPVTDAGRAQLLAAIDELALGGGTWIEGGLEESFKLLDAVPPRAGASKRVMLFTDAQPNVGATTPDSFLALARTYADRDIGLTSFGVGLDLGAELTSELATIRGGSSYTLHNNDLIRSVFDEDFDLMVTPVAYDLAVQGTPSPELEADEGFGAPVDPASGVAFGAATLFLSRKGGGMGITLTGIEGMPLDDADAWVEMGLSYQPARSDETVYAEAQTAFAGGEAHTLQEGDFTTHAADDAGVFTMSLLIDELAALDFGSDYCWDEIDAEAAAANVRQAADRLARAAEQQDSDALRAEALLMETLAENLELPEIDCHVGGDPQY